MRTKWQHGVQLDLCFSRPARQPFGFIDPCLPTKADAVALSTRTRATETLSRLRRITHHLWRSVACGSKVVNPAAPEAKRLIEE
jgi:hypothetical protein